MKDKTVQILFILICLVVCAAVQEMLPAFGGAKPPLLMLFTLHAAFREDDEVRKGGASAPSFRWLAVALGAGAFEDALNGMPSGGGALFALLSGTAARFTRPFVHDIPTAVKGLSAAIVAAPLHELWLSGWGVYGANPALLVRFFASALPAALCGAFLFALLPCLERHIGFDGQQDPEGARR